ncbi:MAG: two-component system response regulator [Nitrospirae bacterium GWD2_57_8]|nr:MAG: two-component system response regulator [Nitrospirae bacterium GWD2_57_8]
MQEARVLIMDDEEKERKRIEQYLARKGHDVLGVGTVEEAVDAISRERFDAFLTDCNIPGVDALKTSSEARKINPDMAVIIMTAFGTIETAVKAIKAGAYDYLPKPIDLDQLALLIERISERQNLIRENTELKEQLRERYKFKEIVSTSQAMEDALNMAGRVAGSTATVLLRGESGTGKELVAKAIHFHSPRAEAPLVKVNCAALPETLLESELFGHEKGAFTGAAARRIGRFEAADGGTLFLDEIGELTPGMQAKLLRALQEKEFERLGGNQTIKVDVRVIAATNRDLEQAMGDGKFREDLYYRLNVVSIVIPPLRDRKEDVPALIDHFVQKYREENRKKISGVSAEARDVLMRYAYPGNVRELENIIERAVVLAKGGLIATVDLPLHLRSAEGEKKLTCWKAGGSLNETLDTVERGLILEALKDAGDVQTRAAEKLGISERVLRYKIKKHRIRSPE